MRSASIKHFLWRIRQIELFDSTGMTPQLRSNLYWVIWGATIGMLYFNVINGAAWTGFQRVILRAGDFELGCIAAVPVAVNIFQLLFSYIMEKRRNRRFLFLFFGITSRSLWIIIGLIPLFLLNAPHSLRISATIMLIALVSSGASFVSLGFGSLMGDLVPIKIRGRYFSARLRISLIAGILSGLIVSWLLDAFGDTGYTLVLVLAGLAGMVDIACFFFVSWPPMEGSEDKKEKEKPFTMFGGVLKNKRFMTLCFFFTCWFFAIGLSSPFNNVYLLEVMHLSFLEITLYAQIVSNIMTMVTVTIWGRAIDRYGNKPVMQLTGLICMCLTMLWLFMQPGRIFLVILLNLLSGFFWVSLDLGQQNLYLGLSEQKNRSAYLAVFFTVTNLIGTALGNTIGGALVQGPFTEFAKLNLMFFGMALNKYHYVYILSTILRIGSITLLLRRIQEDGAVSLSQMTASIRYDFSLWRKRYTKRLSMRFSGHRRHHRKKGE